MAGFLDTVKGFFGSLAAALQAVLGAVGRFFNSLFQAELEIVDNLTRIVENFQRGKQEIEEGIQKIKHFKFAPAWRTRVINVPTAIDAVKMIYEENFKDFRERIGVIVQPIHDLKLIFTAEQETAGATDTPAKLAKTAIKVDEIATMIAQLAAATDQALKFIDFFDKIITDIETLEPLFLGQGNKRRVVTVTAKVRLGKLH